MVWWSHRGDLGHVSFRRARYLCACEAAETAVVVARVECIDGTNNTGLGRVGILRVSLATALSPTCLYHLPDTQHSA